MKKNFKFYAIIWAISIIVFNAIAFVAPTEKEGSFWVGYILIMATFVIQIACSYLFFKQDTKDKVFLNIPILTISYIALIVSIIFGIIFMAVTKLPTWIAVIISLLVTAFYLIAIISTNSATNIIQKVDKEVKTQTFFIKSLTIDAQTLTARAQSIKTKNLTEKVYEAIRYSDPMSNDALASSESAITIKFKDFEKAIINNDENSATTISNELLILINDRNQKCKLLK